METQVHCHVASEVCRAARETQFAGHIAALTWAVHEPSAICRCCTARYLFFCCFNGEKGVYVHRIDGNCHQLSGPYSWDTE